MNTKLPRNLNSSFVPLLVAVSVAALTIANERGVDLVLDVAAVTITATQTAALLVDNDSNGDADPGDTLQYTVVATNTGDMDATATMFDLVLDANTTLVPGSIETTPLARNDSYSSLGNVGITVPSGSGVLANDNDPDGSGLAATPITAFDNPSTNSGAVSVNTADGSFTYTPAPGFNGTDTFTYTIDDDEGNSDIGTVSITVSDLIWFIDNSDGGLNLGTVANPFQTIGAFNSSVDTEAGDDIYIAEAGSTYTAGIVLKNSQTVVGEGASGSDLQTILGISLPTHSNSLPAVGGTNPTITNAAGNGISLGSGNTVRGLTIGNTTGIGISGSGVGTLTASDVTINGTGEILDLSTGTLATTFSALSTTSSAAQGIDLNSVAGTFTVSGAAALSGVLSGGVEITSNSASINFNGGLDIASGGTALAVSGGGILNVLGSGNTINNTTGTGVNITNTTIGASGVTFESIAVNGATNGIVLNSTGTTGGFTVTGDGSDGSLGGDGSGGTIQNTSGTAIDLDATTNFNITSVSIQSPGGDGINALNVSGSNSINSITVNNIVAANTSAVHIVNNSVSLSDFLAQKSKFTDVNATSGQTVFLVEGGGNGAITMQVRVDASEFSNLDPAAYQHATGSVGGDNPTVKTFFTNNSVINGKALSVGTSEVNLLKTQSGNSVFVVEGNTIDNVGLAGVSNGILNIGAVGAVNFGTITGLIKDNNISRTPGKLYGINVITEATGTMGTIDLTIDQNTIDNLVSLASGASYINIDLRGNEPTANIRVTGNNIGSATNTGAGGTLLDGVLIEQDGPFANTMNLLVQGNFVKGKATGGGGTLSPQLFEINADESPGRINATVDGNDFLNQSTGDVLVRSDVSGSAVCLDLSSNTGNVNVQVQQDAGATYETEGVAGNDLATAAYFNGINGINVNASGTFGVNIACTEPPAAPSITPTVAVHSEIPPIEYQIYPTQEEGLAADVPALETSFDHSSANSLISDVPVAIGTFNPGSSITIKYDAAVKDPLAVLGSQICQQGAVSGSNFSSVLTDDPGIGGSADPTCLALDLNLPVELTGFDGTVNGLAVNLTWTTATETNNAGFEVEHACDSCSEPEASPDATAVTWTALGFVEGYGTTTEPQTYAFETAELDPGRHSFRLKQIDFDGTFEYSDVIEATLEIPGQFVLEQAYPNPFNPSATIRFGVAVEQYAALRMYDLNGRIVKTLFEGVPESGSLKEVRISGDGLASGAYVVRLETEGFLASRQVMLLK